MDPIGTRPIETRQTPAPSASQTARKPETGEPAESVEQWFAAEILKDLL
ncbi:MAG: hypothetical protein AB2L14_17850 [Candidatus Xenobiia bacterium LiM19]